MAINKLKYVKPIQVVDSMLVSTNVPENDYPVYVPATSYALNARVIYNHVIYESQQATNVGHQPDLVASATWWLKVSPTNRHKAFDNSTTTKTTQANLVSYRIKANKVATFVGFLAVTAQSIRVRVIDPTLGTVYDETVSMTGYAPTVGWYNFFFARRTQKTEVMFLGLPPLYAADILIDIVGPTVSVGGIVMGVPQELGLGIQYGARVGITDFSRKETNDYGDVELVVRNYARRANYNMWVPNTEIDALQNFLAEIRATVGLWIGYSDYGCTIVYGWCSDFEITIAYFDTSECSLDLKGLT
jgi:hypothetical protein